jgi:RecB family exonuclease
VITPRATRLVRVPDLHHFRDALSALACGGTPFETRDRLILVPTHAGAAHLIRSIEHRAFGTVDAIALPAFATRDEIYARFAERLPEPPPILTGAQREALLGSACRAAIAGGVEPPFRLRPGLVAEILRFFDTLHRNEKDIASFERLALGMLEPGASDDRGAERLVRQTRFLVDAFERFEQQGDAAGMLDEHGLRRHLLETPAARPWRHAVVTIADRAFDRHGLFRADWDFLARVPGLTHLDIVVTDAVVAGALHERILDLLPGIEETRFDGVSERRSPALLIPPTVRLKPDTTYEGDRLKPDTTHAGGRLTHTARDREEEVTGFARWVRHLHRDGDLTALDRAALVVHQPLPYVYIGREVLRSAGIPCQMFDALPLAAEPFAAALDLVFSCVSSNFARVPSIALLRSPHFAFSGRASSAPTRQMIDVGADLGRPVTKREIAALDRALSEAGYLGGADILAQFDGSAAAALQDVVASLLPLRDMLPMAQHLDCVLAFIAAHERVPSLDDPLRERHLRARAAILGILTGLRDAYARFDAAPVDADIVAATVRRWIEAHTFAPRTGDSGVHLVDADSARFGDFEAVQLAGLVDGEWPDRPRRDIFYAPGILRELGWPSESDRLDGVRGAFRDLLRLPSERLIASTFTLEDDAVVAPSTLGDELEAAMLERVEYDAPRIHIFEYEALAAQSTNPTVDDRYRGMTAGHRPPAYSLSALERYQDCPFRFFASDVLRLEEAPEDEPSLSPRARGRFIHEVFQRFFEAWDARGGGTITPDSLGDARRLFEDVAAPLLARLPGADAEIERTRLFGSAISMGIVDVVLGLEATRPVDVRERWLEHRLEGEFSLGGNGRRVPLKGVADRIDLLDGNRLRVIDYKSGYPPNVKRALQVPIYALAAQERLAERDGRMWEVDEAAYVAFSGKRALVPVVKGGAADAPSVLAAARERLFAAVDGVERGEFPPRPHDPFMCGYCAYPSVCRKDYVGD